MRVIAGGNGSRIGPEGVGREEADPKDMPREALFGIEDFVSTLFDPCGKGYAQCYSPHPGYIRTENSKGLCWMGCPSPPFLNTSFDPLLD